MSGMSDFLQGGLVGVGKTMMDEYSNQNQEQRQIRAEQRREEAAKRAETRRQEWQQTWAGMEEDRQLAFDDEKNTIRNERIEAGTDAGVNASVSTTKGNLAVTTDEYMRRKEMGLPVPGDGDRNITIKGLTGAEARDALRNSIADVIGVSETDAKKSKTRPSYVQALSKPGARVAEVLAGEDADPTNMLGLSSDDSDKLKAQREQMRAEIIYTAMRAEEGALNKAARNAALGEDAVFELRDSIISRVDNGISVTATGIEKLMNGKDRALQAFGGVEGVRKELYPQLKVQLFESMGYEENDPKATSARQLWRVYENGLNQVFGE